MLMSGCRSFMRRARHAELHDHSDMKKKPLVVGLGLLFAIGLLVVWAVPALYFPIRGWLFGETSYRGWPTCFWVSALQEQASVRAQMPPQRATRMLTEGGQSAVPVLLEMLRNNDAEIRQQAMQVLAAIGPPPDTVLPDLMGVFEREADPHFWPAAELYVRGIDRAAATRLLAAVLQRNRSDAARIWALPLLGSLAEPAQSVALLEQALQDSNPRMRVRAIPKLAEFSKQDPGALAALRTAVRHQDFQVRLAAVEYLWDIDGDVKLDLPVLLEAIRSQKGQLHHAIAAILRDLGPDASAARRELRNLLSADDPIVRMRAVQAIGSVGIDSSVLPAVIERLKDVSAEVRQDAAAALRDSNAKEAVPLLLPLLRDRSVGVRAEAVLTLGHVKPASAEIIVLIRDLLRNDSQEFVKLQAIKALGAIGPQAKDATADLVGALNDKRLTLFAAEALAAIGPAAHSAIPSLVSRLTSEDDWDRLSAANALWRIEGSVARVLPVVLSTLQRAPSGAASAAQDSVPKPKSSNLAPDPPIGAVRLALKLLCQVEPQTGCPLLCRWIESSNSLLRAEAIWAAKELGPQAKPAVHSLIKVLDEGNFLYDVIEALGTLGPSAAEALPRLQAMAKQAVPPIKRAAARAIQRIHSGMPNTS